MAKQGKTTMKKGTVIKGKPMPNKKKKSKTLAEHTRGLKSALRY